MIVMVHTKEVGDCDGDDGDEEDNEDKEDDDDDDNELAPGASY